MNMASRDQKKYADVATQTSPFTSKLVASGSPAGPVTCFPAATNSLLSYAHSDLISFEGSPERDGSISTAANLSSVGSTKHKPSSLSPPSFPSTSALQGLCGSRPIPTGNRAVSLPETLCDEDLRLVLSKLADNGESEVKEQPRVVSMPESLQLHARRSARSSTISVVAGLGCHDSSQPSLETNHAIDEQSAGAEDSCSNSSSLSTPRTIVVHSLSSDHFHTPSPPPSSCDSVEFTLEDPARLSNSFLSSTTSSPVVAPTLASKAVGLLDDDGWLTWASSPPRPIPALHGPSSLPYARCPSGAEGTIIGEPSSLPQMIWGLDPNDAVPAPHVSQSQQSRVIPTRPLVNPINQQYANFQDLPLTFPASSAYDSTNVSPRFDVSSRGHNSLGELQLGMNLAKTFPTAFAPRREEEHHDNSYRKFRSNAGLGFNVGEESIRLGNLCEYGVHEDAPIRYSVRHKLDTTDRMDGNFDLIQVEKSDDHRFDGQDGRFKQHSFRKGHPPNLVELLSSPVNLSDRTSNPASGMTSVIRRLSTSEITPNYLPTPPNSTSPQWSSVFSPIRNRGLADAFNNRGNISSDCDTRHALSMTNDELSQELRRLVVENMSPASTTNTVEALRVPHNSARNYVFNAHRTPSSSLGKSSTHPPGLPMPQHILLSKTLETFDPLSAQDSSSPSPATSPSTSPYMRSTLSNPRSIPLSRLRQKRGAVKLATVPEEDSTDPQSHEVTLAVPTPHSSSKPSLRTQSPLDDRLHAQSVDDKTTLSEAVPLGQVRVKLPYSTNARTRNVCVNQESGQGATAQGSPRRKRLQRRKKSMFAKGPGSEGAAALVASTVSSAIQAI